MKKPVSALLSFLLLTFIDTSSIARPTNARLRYKIERAEDYDIAHFFLGKNRVFSVGEINFDNPVLIKSSRTKISVTVITSIISHTEYFDEYSYAKFTIYNGKLISAKNCNAQMVKKVEIHKPLSAVELEVRNEVKSLFSSSPDMEGAGSCKNISEVSPHSSIF